jgi:hypothetical protein
VTAPRTRRHATLYALRAVEPWNFILGLFVLFVVQVAAVTFWRLLVVLFYETLADPVQPFVAAMACSLCAFITTVLSRPQGGRDGFAVFGAALISAVAVAVGILLAALAAQTAAPQYSGGILARALVACVGFWSGTPVIYGAVMRFAMHEVEDLPPSGRAAAVIGARPGRTIARPGDER